MCTAEVAAQRQASTAVRDAGAPVVSQALLAALHDIPKSAMLPPSPDELAVTDDGQLVVAQRPSNGRLGSTPPLGSGQPLGSSRRLGSAGMGSDDEDAEDSLTTASGRRLTGRFAQGAGVVVSGLVLGVLVLAAPVDPPGASTAPSSPPPGGIGGGSLPVNAELGHLPYERQELTWTTPERPVGPAGLRAR